MKLLTKEDVGANLGRLVCSECYNSATTVIQLGDDPDYMEETANICRSCIIKALHIFDIGEMKT